MLQHVHLEGAEFFSEDCPKDFAEFGDLIFHPLNNFLSKAPIMTVKNYVGQMNEAIVQHSGG
jgi:hypothetical protein